MDIPCKNCITLAICKVENKTYDKINYIVNPKTLAKCKFIQDYSKWEIVMNGPEEQVIVIKKLHKIRDFLELENNHD